MASPEFAALIGDVVGSRGLPDRAAAQTRISVVLAEVAERLAERLAPGQRLEVTVGDEFQGGFATVADAAHAALLVRLSLLPEVDVRCGIGWGTTTVLDAAARPLLQDGSAWWSAREALDVLGTRARSRSRTWTRGPEQDAVNAYLLTRDALVDRSGERARRILRLLLLGRSQREIAELEGITPAAVSQQAARGVGAVRDAEVLFVEQARSRAGGG